MTGEAITDVAHIGVGGLDLGPKLVSEVLGNTLGKRFVGAHYVSTMGGSQLLPLMHSLNPATTLIVLVSKSFSTADTQFNVRTALAWLSDALGMDIDTLCRYQMLGVSAKPEKMSAFSIPEEHQLVHQGSHTVSADFIAVARRNRHQAPGAAQAMADQENLALANCLAQSQLLALGDAAITDNLRDSTPLGYRGNQPNTVILLETVDAWTLGALLAMYEHKVFVQSVFWGINPFDQPGVELGKKLATTLYHTLSEPQPGMGNPEHEIVNDAGTRQLLKKLQQWRAEDTQYQEL